MPFISTSTGNKYKIFHWGREYNIDDDCIEKLKNLEEYREFIWSYKAPIVLPIIIFSLPLAGIISWINNDFSNLETIWSKNYNLFISDNIFIFYTQKCINC